jgi:hypothetical protein
MRKITDDDLTLLFYGEHEDPALAATVAESEELTGRFDSLSAELRLADNFVPPHREDDYGAEVWRKISPRLDAEHAETGGRLKAWLASFSQPRFSLAGALSLSLVAMLAFMLGRNGSQDNFNTPLNPVNQNTIALAGVDSNRLLTHSVSGHLEQVNLVLTQFVNTPETGSSDAGYATDMLVANRLYRQAATSQGKLKLAAFLADLEPLLIELAYQAQSGSTATRERMQQEVRDGLLFRVRVMNKQLNKPQISV